MRLKKKKIIKEDGRYLIFYEFEEEGKKDESPAPDSKTEEQKP